MTKPFFLLLCGLLLATPAHAAPGSALRYFEGELLIEESSDQGDCQRIVGNTKGVQISLQEIRKGVDSHFSGWMVVVGGAPGKLGGALPAQLTVTTNYYDAHFNTPMTLSLDIADGKATGILRETQAKLYFGEKMCFWQKAKLTLTEKTAITDVGKKLREHAARYKAYAHESRGDYHVRYNNYPEAAIAHDQAIAEVEGILPDTHDYFTGLLDYTGMLYAKINDYEHAAQRYQRVMDINVRQSKTGADDPALYRGWIRLAIYLYLAKHNDEAITNIERAARLEDKAKDVDLDERLVRRRLQGNIYIAAKMFDKAQASLQDEANLATAEAGPDDARTFEARVQMVHVMKAMKDHARLEATLEPLAKEITARFGKSHKLARDSNELLGMHYYRNDDGAKARPWLESAFRGHRALFDNAAQAVRQNEDAKGILATLLDIYITQGIVPKDFLDQVRAGQVTLDDLPFQEPQPGGQSMSTFKIKPVEWDKLLKH
jgi:tetratricopeptide (TPR) repeat protein